MITCIKQLFINTITINRGSPHHRIRLVFLYTKDDSLHKVTNTRILLWHQPCNYKHETDKTQLKFINKNLNTEYYQDHTFFLFLFPPKKRRNPKRGFIGGFRKSGDLLLAVDDTMRVCYTQIKPHFQKSRNSRSLLLARREKREQLCQERNFIPLDGKKKDSVTCL